MLGTSRRMRFWWHACEGGLSWGTAKVGVTIECGDNCYAVAINTIAENFVVRYRGMRYNRDDWRAKGAQHLWRGALAGHG